MKLYKTVRSFMQCHSSLGNQSFTLLNVKLTGSSATPTPITKITRHQRDFMFDICMIPKFASVSQVLSTKFAQEKHCPVKLSICYLLHAM